jgi:hypothetical protein
MFAYLKLADVFQVQRKWNQIVMSWHTWNPHTKHINQILQKNYKTTDNRLFFITYEEFGLSGYRLIHLVCQYKKWLFHEAVPNTITREKIHSFPEVHRFLLHEEPINTHIVKGHFLVTNFSTFIQIRDLDDNENQNLETIHNVSILRLHQDR